MLGGCRPRAKNIFVITVAVVIMYNICIYIYTKAFAAELTDGHQSWASLRMKEFAQKPVSVTYILLQHANWKLSNFVMFSVLLLFPSFTVELY